MVPSAELRVYQPLEAFSPDEQARWERHLIEDAPRSLLPRYRDGAPASPVGFLEPVEEDGAHVKVVEGVAYVCPWRTRLRVLAGLLAFRAAEPFEGAAAFVSKADAKRASKELARMRRRQPNAIATIMQSPWHVPVRWFVLFEDDERRIVEADGRYGLSYLASTRNAIRRAERAVPALRRTDLGPIAELIVELHDWLSLFAPRSLVELDYGRLSDLMTWDEMDDDHSAREIQEALVALSSGAFPRSADLYQSVLARTAELRNHESWN